MSVKRSLPVLRGDCLPGGAQYQRPCPFTRCRYHLAEERGASGGRPPTVVRDTSQTCALDVADDGRTDFVTIGRLLGVSRERVRQIETKALKKLARAAKRSGLDFGEAIRIKSSTKALLGTNCGGDIDSRGRDRAKLREYRARYEAKLKLGAR
jgi:hypothetical protein